MSEMFGREEGLGLVQVVVMSGVGMTVLFALLNLAQNNWKASRRVNTATDADAIAMDILATVDCDRTLAAGFPRCVDGSYVELRRRDGSPVVGANGTKFGRWTVRAKCTPSGLELRSAQLTDSGAATAQALDFGASDPSWFRKDEILKSPLSWSVTLLLPPGPGGVCADSFNPTPTTAKSCLANQYVTGVNLATKQVSCQNIPTCASGQGLTWTGGAFSCVSVPSLAEVTSTIIPQEIAKNISDIKNTPFSCFTSRRVGAGDIQNNSPHVSRYNNGRFWGMFCNRPYRMTACTIGQSGNANCAVLQTISGVNYFRDWDVFKIDGESGCSTDTEERIDGATLAITCCKQGDLP